MREASVQLLGIPNVNLNGVSFAFLDDKRYQLLAYLACKNDWVSREVLSNLFWSDTDSASARKNLRHLIGRTKTLTWLTGFEAELEHLRFVVASDLSAFKTAFEQGAWNTVIELYRGVLLEGLNAEDSPEFASWLETERENLQEKWRTAALNQARALHQRQACADALSILEMLLKHDPLDEEAMNDFMQLSAETGQGSTALRTFEHFSKRLQTELNLPPPINLERLAGSIRANNFSSSQARVATLTKPKPQSRLPVVLTPFVGRELVLAELTNLLEQGEFRLLTLVGQGGVGKTRIALQIAQEQRNLEVVFVNLVPLEAPNGIPSAIAEAINLQLQGQDTTIGQVINHIASRRMLLVIDNFEQVMAGATYLNELLQGCENLVLLVTSREATSIQGEQIVRVEACFVAESTEIQSSEIASLEAVQLFSQHARRVRPDFRPQEQLTQILEICRLVDGLPLAIELAAVWVRALSVTEIADEIAQNLDFLDSHNTNLNERHRSVRAAFEHSWKLLTQAEQLALSRLSVFRGGFTREAMRQAVQMPLSVLSSLIDKSLLAMNAQGRYKRHKLLHQYALEKLQTDPSEIANARSNHAQYYFALLQNGLEGIRGPNSKAALEMLEVELENILKAWRWAIEGHKVQFLKNGTEALMRFFDARGRFHEAIEVFGEAIAQLRENDSEDFAALGTLLVHQSKFFARLGQNEAAEVLALRGVTVLEPLAEHETMIWGLGGLGVIANAKGLQPQAAMYRTQALTSARAIANERLIAVCLGWMAISQEDMGNITDAKQHYREAIHLFKKLGNRIGTLFNLNNLAALMGETDEYQEALPLLLEALELAKLAGELSQVPIILAELGNCYQHLGAFNQAFDCVEQALKLEQQQETPTLENQVDLLVTLGKISAVKSETVQAKAYLNEALGKVWDVRQLPVVMDIVLEWATLLASDTAFGIQLACLVNQHPASRTITRERATKALETWNAPLPDASEHLELEQAVRQILFG
jgi:predicted ATPase/DNA-binding SARP family transcriptional activator